MITTKLKHFLELGFAAAAITLSMGVMANGLGDKATPNTNLLYNSSIAITQDTYVKLASDIAKDNIGTTAKFSEDKFFKKYHINGENIKIIPLYLAKGLPFSWKNSQIITNRDNPDKFSIVLVLDKNGDLYNIDQDFKGKNKLTQIEKDLLKEQTLLHEYAHTHFFHGNKMQSTKLTSDENITFKNTFLAKYQNVSTNNVYQETASEISSTILLINSNQQNLPTVKGLLNKLNDIETAERNEIIAEGNYDSHLMMYKGQQKVLKDFNHFKNMNLKDVLDYTVPLTSDLVVEYTTKFNGEHGILKTLENFRYNNYSLLNIVHDIVYIKNIQNDNVNPNLYSEAQKLIEKHPEFQKEVIFNQIEGSLSLNLKTLYLASNVDTKFMYVDQLNYGNLSDEQANTIVTSFNASIKKVMKNETYQQAAQLIAKLDQQYKTSPTQFETLPEYNVSHSLTDNNLYQNTVLKKSSVLNNIFKMKQQSLNTTSGNSLKM